MNKHNEDRKKTNERGSLSLEHILFIGAVVLIAAGLGTFYGNISTYFTNVNLGDATNVGGFNPSGGGAGGAADGG
jgi:Flp pilus assembly pilin Flp